MAENGIRELTLEQLEELCKRAERAAREHVLSKIPKKRVDTLDVIVDAEGTKPLTVNIDVKVVLSPLMKDFDVEALTKEATERAIAQIEEYLRETTCIFKKS